MWCWVYTPSLACFILFTVNFFGVEGRKGSPALVLLWKGRMVTAIVHIRDYMVAGRSQFFPFIFGAVKVRVSPSNTFRESSASCSNTRGEQCEMFKRFLKFRRCMIRDDRTSVSLQFLWNFHTGQHWYCCCMRKKKDTAIGEEALRAVCPRTKMRCLHKCWPL